MGVDFINAKKDAFFKRLDRARVENSTPNLFRTTIQEEAPHYLIRMRQPTNLEIGEFVTVLLQSDDNVVVMKGLDVVGDFMDPTEELIHALKESNDEACGSIVKVHENNPIAESTVW